MNVTQTFTTLANNTVLLVLTLIILHMHGNIYSKFHYNFFRTIFDMKFRLYSLRA